MRSRFYYGQLRQLDKKAYAIKKDGLTDAGVCFIMMTVRGN